jgi:DNA modification methylase
MPNITIHNTDVIEWLKNYNGPKFHGVISDPPYGLAFMGKTWDKFTPKQYQDWCSEWSSLLLNHLYPGSVCMFFGGTRTYHRLATGLEDAGFEIFDSMMFLYGSGFPKAADISKGIDKKFGLDREITGKESNFGITTIADGKVGYGDYAGVWDITKPNHPLAQKWNGYKTALKPAFEPIVLCRKPRGKETFVDCVLNYGTGALNVDGSRIGTNGRPLLTLDAKQTNNNAYSGRMDGSLQGGSKYLGETTLGRFPANLGLICDCEKEPCECIEKELDNNSGYLLPAWNKKEKNERHEDNSLVYGKYNQLENNPNIHNNKGGGASRFFYTAKSSRKERNLGLDQQNNHPTVKPIKLIEYLATMLKPPVDSSILIPFSGSGSEIIGAMFAGWNVINAIEIDENYCNIAKHRVNYWKQFSTYADGLKDKQE